MSPDEALEPFLEESPMKKTAVPVARSESESHKQAGTGRRGRTKLCLWGAVLALLAPSVARPQQVVSPRTLLGQLTGTWVLEGTIDGNQVTHDVEAGWVLGEHYVQLREVSREKDATGKPEYQAIVYLAWEPAAGEYACLWLDSTGGGGLTAQAIGHAKPHGDEIRLVFAVGDGSSFHTTFAYDEAADTWQWSMDIEREGSRVPFARVVLERR